MRMPVLNVIKQKTEGITQFVGLDHRKKVRPNAFYDMRNMSGDMLPVMSTRKKRTYLRTLLKPNGLIAHDSLCWVDGTDFYYSGEVVGQVTDGEKQLVRMGAWIVIFPDAKRYNTQTGEFSPLGAMVKTEDTVTCTLSRADGTGYTYTASETAPEDPEAGQHWLDTSETPNVLRTYSTAQGMWVSVPTVYTRIEAYGIGKQFAQYDGITISGMTIDALNGSFFIVDRGEDWITVTALIAQMHEQTERVTVERLIPQMDYVCEHENRLWGCSNEKHEIYACTLGDPTNWNQFIGQATDSYAVTVGTSGDFTGCAAHLGGVWFFKEDCVHRILGYKPANFQLDTTNCRGVQKGSERSLCVVNETLMYKARNDVCRMGNALPSTISDPLGDMKYSHAAGGADNRRYYMCMRDEEGCPHILVYDTERGSWMAEDELDVKWFAAHKGELYMLCANGQLWSVNGGGVDEYGSDQSYQEEDLEWMLDTGVLGIDEPFNRYLSGIQIYCGCQLGTQIMLDVRYDAEKEWRQVFRSNPSTTRSMTIPYVPHRCRTIRLRLRGRGEFQLYQIIKRIEQGSDVYGVR